MDKDTGSMQSNKSSLLAKVHSKMKI